MPTDERRAAGRRRAWGRKPIILRFEPLEGRQLLSTSPTAAALPDLVGQSFQTPTTLNWGSSFQAQGVVVNQGTAPVTKSFQVDIYASPTPVLGQGAVLLGNTTISGGLPVAGQSSFNVPLKLPSVPLAGLSSSGSFYLAMVIDPQNAITESNKSNNSDVGAGFDYELVSPPSVQSASLVGNALTISPSETDWGGTFTLSQQIVNVGTGDAPPTRALVVLTPAGSTPGGSADVSIGSITIPALAAGQSTTINPTILLPQTPPSAFAGVSGFTLSVVQDADYVTDHMYPHEATQGLGQDQGAITITTPSFVSPSTAAQPGLEVLGVAADSAAIKWGQSIQVGATLENAGSGDPGPFRVRFLLVGPDGTLNNALFLADTTVSDLAPGATQNIETVVTLPSTIPGGATLNSAGQARIAVVIDPENTIDEPRTNIAGVSSILQLQVVGTNGETTPASTILTPTTTTKTPATTTKTATPPAQTTAAKPKATTTTKTSTKKPATTPKPAASPKRRVPPKPAKHTLEHNLKVFPQAVANYFKARFKT